MQCAPTKTRSIYHATGTVGGYYTQEPIAKPSGGAWRVVFTSPNTVTLQDVRMGGSVNLQRVQ